MLKKLLLIVVAIVIRFLLLFGFGFSYVLAQEIPVFTISTDLIDLKNIFAGEILTRNFKVSLDPSVVNKVLNYKIIRPSNNFCQSILFKPEEENDAVDSAYLFSSTDREDVWQLIIYVPELEGRTLKEGATTTIVGNYECNLKVEAISLENETPQPSPQPGNGGGQAPSGPSRQGSGGGFLIVSQQEQQKGLQTPMPLPSTTTISVAKAEDLYLINESFVIKEIGPDYIIIMFNTSLPSFVRIIYDEKSHDPAEFDKKNYGYAFSTQETTASGSFFEIKLVGLKPDTAYYFRIVMRNPNFTTLSKEFYVKTLALIKAEKPIKEPSLSIATPTVATPTPPEKVGRIKDLSSLLKLFNLASLWNLAKNLPIEIWLIIILILVLIINYLRQKVKQWRNAKKYNLFTKFKKYIIILLRKKHKDKKD